MEISRDILLFRTQQSHLVHPARHISSADHGKLACSPSFGRAPMLVYVRPSNEALLRARVPGAQDQHGCPSNPFIVGALRARRTVCLLPRSPSDRACLSFHLLAGRPDCPSLRASNEHSVIVRVARAQRAVWLSCPFPFVFREAGFRDAASVFVAVGNCPWVAPVHGV